MFPPLNSIPFHIVLQDIQAQHLANYEAFQGYRRHDEAYTVPRICCLHRGIGAKSETYPNDGFKTEHRWQMEVAVALLKRAGWAHDELTAYRALAAGAASLLFSPQIAKSMQNAKLMHRFAACRRDWASREDSNQKAEDIKRGFGG